VGSCAAEGAPLVLARPDSNGARAIRKLARTLDTLAMADRESRDARARLLRLAGEVG
jgi:MinD-like ATPase involved in chromosome partitioning or flagellar assembly